MSDTHSRAEAARRKILDSGDPDLIKRLHLLEATAPSQGAAQPPGAQTQSPHGSALPGILGIGAAAMGGAWLGTLLGGMAVSREIEQAFAEVAEGMGLDLGALDAAEGAEAIDTAHDGGDDDFLGGFDDFFDI